MADQKEITEIFTKYSTPKLNQHLGPWTDYILDFSTQFMAVCRKISNGKIYHITNDAMAATLDGYTSWGAHVAVGNRCLVWKLKYNAEILRFNKERYEDMIGMNNDDPFKKDIINKIKDATDCKTIMKFWEGLSFKYLRIFALFFSFIDKYN